MSSSSPPRLASVNWRGADEILLLLSAQAVGSASSLGQGVLLARSLGPDAYARLAFALVCATFVIQLLSVKTSNVITPVFVQSGHETHRLRAVLGRATCIEAMLALLALVVLLASQPAIATWVRSIERSDLVLSAAFVGLQAVSGPTVALLLATGRRVPAAVVEMVLAALPLMAVAMLMAILRRPTVTELLTALFAGRVLGLMVALPAVCGILGGRKSRGFSERQRQFRQKQYPAPGDFFWSWLQVSASGAASSGPLLLAGGYLSPGQFAELKVALLVAGVVGKLRSVLEQASLSEIAPLRGRTLRTFLSGLTFRRGVLGAIVAATTGGIGAMAIPLVFGDRFRAAVLPALVSAVGLALVTPVFWNGALAFALRQHRLLLVGQLGHAFIALGLMFLASRWGSLGAAFAIVIARMCYEAGLTAALVRDWGIRRTCSVPGVLGDENPRDRA